MSAWDEGMPKRLGAYRLLERIGEGGMGVVFLARGPDRQLVALKVLRPGIAEEPTARHRLAREVETMRRVVSPHVAEVIGADLAGTMPYIVTRYVPGQTLDEVVDQDGPLLGADLARLARGLAEALVAVHAAGVVHRDLKPGNVMLLDGEPVVIDFGIAQGPDATRLTVTGMFMGTPGYLSPEVIEGRPSSEASDVHAWGATVAFAATGRPPFGTGPYETIFYRIVNGQPDLAGAPAPMLPLLASALAREPAHRPPATSLNAQAQALDPGGLTAANAVAGAFAQGTGALTRADLAAWPVPAGLADPLPGGSGQSGMDGALPSPPFTQPLAAGGPVEDDFADVLPPVEYLAPRPDGAAGPRPPEAGAPGGQPMAGDAGVQPGRSRARWHPLLVVGAMLVAAGASVIFPVVGTLVSLAFVVLLRAGELGRRRGALGGTPGAKAARAVARVVAFPWYLLRSLVALLVLAPFALVVALVVGAVALTFVPGHPLPRAFAYAAGALIVFYGLGPGSARSRRQLTRFFATAVRGRLAQAVALVGMTALAGAAVAAAVSWPSFYWPTGSPTGWPLVGRLGQLGLAAHVLLIHLHGW